MIIGKDRRFGEWLAAEIEAHGHTQKDFAARTGLSPQYINDVVHGRRTPPRKTVQVIADALGESADYPSALCGHLPPSMDDIHPDDLAACIALVNMRREIWPRGGEA